LNRAGDSRAFKLTRRHIVFPKRAFLPVFGVFLAVLALALSGCPPDSKTAFDPLPDSDLRPPALLEAGPAGSRRFLLRFDETISPIEGSFAVEPASSGPLAAGSSGSDLSLDFPADMKPGLDYRVAGEVEDERGNVTRFALAFVGWNERPPRLRISEVQAGKNSSTTKPHRDYLELECETSGDLGGVEAAWASSVKAFRYRFPSAEVEAGDFVVLHLAPSGAAEEVDETGVALDLSGGVDATASGRDFWSTAGGLPDENGAVAIYERPGGKIISALFYADEAKMGELGSSKLGSLVEELASAGRWPIAGAAAAWDDAFGWKPSVSRSICLDAGNGQWYVSALSAQSPGEVNPPAP
jgi:hypothetical protein